jgi:hypothetical protein
MLCKPIPMRVSGHVNLASLVNLSSKNDLALRATISLLE